jgi:hypothetical protein
VSPGPPIHVPGSGDELAPELLYQRTFIPVNFLKRDLIPLCAKERIPLTRDRTLPVIRDDIKKIFLALHLSEGTAIHITPTAILQNIKLSTVRESYQRLHSVRYSLESKKVPD